MSNVTAVLDRLRAHLGLGEDPPGSNHNFITVWYNDNVSRIGNGPWCEMTQTWAMWTAGLRDLKVGRAYTVWGAEDGQKHAKGAAWFPGTKGMKAGDQVYYDWSGSRSVGAIDHTGRCEKVMGDGTFYSLEGNISDRLLRVRRDSKYVVGYVRPNFAGVPVVPAAPKPAPRAKPVKNPSLVKHIQYTLEVKTDGQWGRNTDTRALRMRTAARAKAGYPRHVKKSFNVRDVQAIVDTSVDGVWGPRSQQRLVLWIKQIQRALGVTADGSWGPKTDNAFLAARKKYHNNY